MTHGRADEAERIVARIERSLGVAPPETPLRTLARRVKIWTPLVLLLVIVFAVVQSVRPLPTPTLDLTAQDGYTFDGGTVDIPWPAEGQAALAAVFAGAASARVATVSLRRSPPARHRQPARSGAADRVQR